MVEYKTPTLPSLSAARPFNAAWYNDGKDDWTVYGCAIALIAIKGKHTGNDKLDERHSVSLVPKMIEDCVHKIGTTTVDRIRVAVGEPWTSTDTTKPCPNAYCVGGIVIYYACDHEEECEECKGQGEVGGVIEPDERRVGVKGFTVDGRFAANLLQMIDESSTSPIDVLVSTKEPKALMFSHPDWRFLQAAMNDSEVDRIIEGLVSKPQLEFV